MGPPLRLFWVVCTILPPWWRFRNVANFGKEVNFVPIKNVVIKNVQTGKGAKCSPEFQSFETLILSLMAILLSQVVAILLSQSVAL